MMKIQHILKITFLSIFISGGANATLITNGDFSSGFSGWSTSKDVSIQSSSVWFGSQGMIDSFAGLSFKDRKKGKLWQDFDVTGLSKIKISFDWVFNYLDLSDSKKDVYLSFLRDSDNTSVNKIRLQRKVTRDRKNEKLFWDNYSEIHDISSWNANTARLEFSLTDNMIVQSRVGIDNVSVAPVPEPSTILLFGAGLAGLVAVRRKRQK